MKLKEIELKINKGNISEWTKFNLIEELDNISKVSSFGARNNPKNKYYLRMIKCNELIKRLQKE